MTTKQGWTRRTRWLGGAVSGLIAGAVALGVAQLAAGITGPLGSPVVAVGDVAINLTPVSVKDFAIAHFGSHGKDALLTGVVAMLAVAALAAGLLAARRTWRGLAVLAVFGAVGAAAVSQPGAAALDVLPTLAGVAAAAPALTAMAMSSSSSMSSSAMPSSAAMSDFGPGCAAVPKSGAGSLTGMSAARVATAASSNPVLSTLVQAVKKAGLVDTLNSASGITVFAPDNSAFAKIRRGRWARYSATSPS